MNDDPGISLTDSLRFTHTFAEQNVCKAVRLVFRKYIFKKCHLISLPCLLQAYKPQCIYFIFILSVTICFAVKGIYSQDSDIRVLSHIHSLCRSHWLSIWFTYAIFCLSSRSLALSPFFLMKDEFSWNAYYVERKSNAKHEKLFYGATVVQSLD